MNVPRTVHSVCALDCPDGCSLLIDIDEQGRGSRLRGNPAHPVTRGFLCGKVARYLEHEYSPDRLLYPLRRVGAKGEGRFARISWDEALDEIAVRLRSASGQWGPESILPYSYAGTMGLLNGSGMDRRFFHRLGASRLDRTICSTAGMEGMNDAVGHRYAVEPEQFRHAKLIVAWGANVLGTNVHLWPFIVEARRNGAKFYTIDPFRNRTGKLSDRHFAIHPGTDAALALAMMHVIIRDGLEDGDYVEKYTLGFAELKERVREWTPDRAAQLTGLPAQDIVELAREYATTRPAVIRLNYGVQRSERGAMSVRTIALLPALTGAWRDPGGGVQLSTSYAFQLNRPALEMPELQLKSPLGKESRIVNMALLGDALTSLSDPPVKAMVVYNSNPAAIAPDQNTIRRGLRRDDLFTVVLEQVQTDTADFADIVLPVTTFLEHTDLYTSYGHYYLQLARPALAAPGETRSNQDIFRELARRMGLDDSCFTDTDDDMIRAVLGSGHPHLSSNSPRPGHTAQPDAGAETPDAAGRAARVLSSNSTRPGHTAQPDAGAETPDAAGRAARALSSNSTRPGHTAQPDAAAETPDAAGRAARALKGVTLEVLDEHHFVRLNLPDPFLPFAEGGFGTPSGKCEFHAETLDYTPPIESRHGDQRLKARFPLELISPKGDDNMNSTMASRPENNAHNGLLTLNPADAESRGIRANDSVRVFNERGECRLRAAIEETVAQGVVCARSTRWPKLAGDGNSVNMLTPARLTDKGGGPTFYSCLVQVEKTL